MAHIKQLWRGAFKVGHGVVILYAYAYTERQAWMVMCRRIAKHDGVPIGAVMDTADYSITKEMEITEGEDRPEEGGSA